LRNPGKLVMIWDKNPLLGPIVSDRMPTALENFREWKRQSRSFEDLAAAEILNCNLTGGSSSASDRPERAIGMRVSLNFFPLLGIKPAVGRAFTKDETTAGGGHSLILSADLYRRRFGKEAGLTGKTIRVNGISHVVVGVLPAKFRFPGMYGGLN